jgi:hypothetical protein
MTDRRHHQIANVMAKEIKNITPWIFRRDFAIAARCRAGCGLKPIMNSSGTPSSYRPGPPTPGSLPRS